MKIVIDRIEDGIATIELENGKLIWADYDEFPKYLVDATVAASTAIIFISHLLRITRFPDRFPRPS